MARLGWALIVAATVVAIHHGLTAATPQPDGVALIVVPGLFLIGAILLLLDATPDEHHTIHGDALALRWWCSCGVHGDGTAPAECPRLTLAA